MVVAVRGGPASRCLFMSLGATAWISLPLVGAAIGYATNRLAVAMLFRPLRPRRILGLRIQGLVPRRQGELAESIGRVVGDHLIDHKDLVAALDRVDLETLLGTVIERGLQPKLEELRRLPLVGGFLTEERVADLRAQVVRGISDQREVLFEELERAVEEGLDVRALVTEKVREFPIARLEELILEVARRELRAIELLGGLLGLLVGLAQAGLLEWLA